MIVESILSAISAGVGAVTFRKRLLELDVGKHNDMPDSEFDKKSLKSGIKIEKEHSDNPKIQKAIAKDHLSEYPNYYNKLPKMEKECKKEISKEE